MVVLKLEIRSNNEMTIEGYVNAVCRDSRIFQNEKGQFVEQVRQNTFAKAIQNAENIELRYNHDKIIGNTQSGSLILFEDNIGLYAKAYINDYSIIQKAKKGELKGWSFGFIAIDETWEEFENFIKRRYLNEIELVEVSILDVTPGYFATSINNVEIRSYETDKKEEIDKKIKIIHQKNKVELDILSLGGLYK